MQWVAQGRGQESSFSCIWTLDFFKKYSDVIFMLCYVILFIHLPVVTSYFILVPKSSLMENSSGTLVYSD